jgi:prefoldin subunit 5
MKGDKIIQQFTDAFTSIQNGFKTVEEHENALDARITALEERIAMLEEEVREAGIEPTNPCGK